MSISLETRIFSEIVWNWMDSGPAALIYPSESGSGETSNDTSGSGETSSDTSGSGETSSDTSGSGETSSDTSGSGETSSDTSGSGETSSDTSGSGETSSDTSGSGTYSLRSGNSASQTSAPSVGPSSTSTRTQGQFRRQISFSGSGDPEVNGIWYVESAQVEAFSSSSHDLTNLVQSIYGAQIPISFASLCCLYLFNRSENFPLVLANSGSSAVPDSLTDGFANVTVPPGGFFMLCNPASNLELTSARNEIRLENPSASPIVYDLFVSGTKK